MNNTYAQHASPLYHRESRQDVSFQSSSTYTSAPTMSLPQQAHIPSTYVGSFIPLASSRTPITESMHTGEVIPSLPSGGQPPSSEPMSTSRHHNGKKYQLVVVQQPQRARMCGFGDKDRRPITPPPCVKLIVTDLDTGKESDFNAIEHGMFVLNVDLWSADGKSEVNLVRQTANSPTVPSTLSGAYQDGNHSSYQITTGVKSESGQTSFNHYPSNDSAQAGSFNTNLPGYTNGQAPYHQGLGQQSTQAYPSPNGYSQSPTPQQLYFNVSPINPTSPQHRSYPDPSQGQLSPYPNRCIPSQDHPPRLIVNNQPQGMFTRNLIGSLAASASRLTDPDDKIGIWFVLQDLSVRTEGDFRLRFTFVDVSELSPPGVTNSSGVVSKTRSPILARCFSDVFSVYSAKRFPGVVESTPLSRCFATQGIRIPIRKDTSRGERENNDEDE